MKKYRKRDNYIALRVTAVLLGFTILTAYAFYSMRPVIITYAVSKAETTMLNSANEAVLEILKSESIEYDDIIILSRGVDNSVTSLSTNIVKINRLKSLVANQVSKIVDEQEFYDLYIPLGTFFSSVYTGGIGPKLHFKMQMTATARVNFSHDFKSAGINQVLHIVMIDMDISGSLIIAGFKDSIKVSTSAIAAETIIVGATPEAFTQVIESETDNTAGLINDYGAVAGK